MWLLVNDSKHHILLWWGEGDNAPGVHCCCRKFGVWFEIDIWISLGVSVNVNVYWSSFISQFEYWLCTWLSLNFNDFRGRYRWVILSGLLDGVWYNMLVSCIVSLLGFIISLWCGWVGKLKNMAFEAIESIKWLLSFRVGWWLIRGMLLSACSSMENEPRGISPSSLSDQDFHKSQSFLDLELGEGFHPLTRVSKGSTNRRIGIQIA